MANNGVYIGVSNYVSDEFLHVNTAGVSRVIFVKKPHEVRIWRPNGRVDFHILLVNSGCATVVFNNQKIKLYEGDGMLYFPNDEQDYRYNVSKDDGTQSHLFVHFSGTAAEEILVNAGLTHSQPFFKATAEIKRVFESVVRDHVRKNDLSSLGNLLRLISLLSPKSTAFQGESVKLILREVEYINSHYTENIDFDVLADRCFLSRSRFSHLFSETVGESPLKYQQRLRMEQACELLTYSTQSIEEVAKGVGFSDALYFSRLFKKIYGVSPLQFRNQ